MKNNKKKEITKIVKSLISHFDFNIIESKNCKSLGKICIK